MGKRSFRIRPMVPPDLREVVAIEEVSFPSPWKEEFFLGELGRGAVTRALVVEEREGEEEGQGGLWAIRGYVLAWLVEDELHINDLAVDPAHRKRGFAHMLLGEILSQARSEGARMATLEVRVGNFPAVRLYTSLGFKKEGRRRGYYPDGEDALILTRGL